MVAIVDGQPSSTGGLPVITRSVIENAEIVVAPHEGTVRFLLGKRAIGFNVNSHHFDFE